MSVQVTEFSMVRVWVLVECPVLPAHLHLLDSVWTSMEWGRNSSTKRGMVTAYKCVCALKLLLARVERLL